MMMFEDRHTPFDYQLHSSRSMPKEHPHLHSGNGQKESQRSLSTSAVLRKTSSSGQMLQNKQMGQIEELEKIISQKMSIIKDIDHLIKVNRKEKKERSKEPGKPGSRKATIE